VQWLGYGLDGPRFESRQGQEVPSVFQNFQTSSGARSACCSVRRGDKAAGTRGWSRTSSIAEVTNNWSYASVSVYSSIQCRSCTNPWHQVVRANIILYGGAEYVWTLSMELASCHPSIACTFEGASRFLKNLRTLGAGTVVLLLLFSAVLGYYLANSAAQIVILILMFVSPYIVIRFK